MSKKKFQLGPVASIFAVVIYAIIAVFIIPVMFNQVSPFLGIAAAIAFLYGLYWLFTHTTNVLESYSEADDMYDE